VKARPSSIARARPLSGFSFNCCPPRAGCQRWHPADLFPGSSILDSMIMVSQRATRHTTALSGRAFRVFVIAVAMLSLPAARGQASKAGSSSPSQILPRSAMEADPQLQIIASEIEHGSYSKAESDARAYLLREPNSPAGHNLLGYVLYRENKAKDSLAEYTAGARYQKPDANDLAVTSGRVRAWLPRSSGLGPRAASRPI